MPISKQDLVFQEQALRLIGTSQRAIEEATQYIRDIEDEDLKDEMIRKLHRELTVIKNLAKV
jgi:hypothetical protein